MAKVSLSGKEKSIEFIYNWYEDQKEALLDLRNKIIGAVKDPASTINVKDKFISLTLEEINDYFDNSEDELEHLVCFDILSATEALLRIDYYQKVFKKDKSPTGRQFRSSNNTKGGKISLDEDIIEVWENITGDKAFSDLLGLFKYRHWLAHGRYWEPKLGRNYTVDIAYEISENIFEAISNNSTTNNG